MSRPAFNLDTCARPNILSLQPYRCARESVSISQPCPPLANQHTSDYKDDGTNILLDANENAYGPGLDLDEHGRLDGPKVNGAFDLAALNRYPDPHQTHLKQLLCKLRNTHLHTAKMLTPSNLFVGVGSDEAIDNLLRCFCTPGRDRILVCPPTYGMYTVSATVNDIDIVRVPLLVSSDFGPDVPAISAALTADPRIKLVYLCSPGNPTGALIPKSAVVSLLAHASWNGVVVVDEAYIDFAASPSASLAELVLEHPNLVVMQTLSKAFGLAGIRLGAAFASPAVARLLNSFKAPYNVSSPTSHLAVAALAPSNLAVVRRNIGLILRQRDVLISELPKIPGVGRFKGGFDANFVLVEMLDAPGGRPCNVVASRVYADLADSKGVVVRFRGKELGCEGCLRVTVGTEDEVKRFLLALAQVLQDVYKSNPATCAGDEEERRENAANGVIA